MRSKGDKHEYSVNSKGGASNIKSNRCLSKARLQEPLGEARP